MPISPPSVRRLLLVLATAVGSFVAALHLALPPQRIGLALLAMAALAEAQLPARWLAGLRRRCNRHGRDTVLLALAVAALAQTTALDLQRYSTSHWVRVWNVYHYYLGAKYFAELGFDDLYAASLAADREGANYWRKVDRVRDLASYEIWPRERVEAAYRPGEHFSAERWQAFQADVTALQRQMPARGWRGIFRDRGYNPSPFWTAVGAPLTRLFPATSLAALKALTALDLLLLAATFWLLQRTFGLRTASLVLLLLALSPVNAKRLVGGFLQYDWFCALAAGAAWLKERRPLPAAAALAYASLARLFPLVLVASLLAPALRKLVARRRLDGFALRFGGAFAAFLTAGLLLGLASGRGLAGWEDFAQRIERHTQEHTFGEQRLGLKHFFTHDLGSADLDLSNAERRAAFARQQGPYRVAAGGFLLLWALALWRRGRQDAFVLGFLPFFALTVASRYYWASIALLPTLGAPTRRRRMRVELLALAQLTAYFGYWAFNAFHPEAYASYTVLNGLLGICLLGLGLTYLWGDWRVWQRWRGGLRPRNC